MLVVHVDIAVLPDRVTDFLTASVTNATASLDEPGVLRFDVLRDEDDPAHVVALQESGQWPDAGTLHARLHAV